MINICIILVITIIILVILKKYDYFTSNNIVFIDKNNACNILKDIQNDYKYNNMDIELRDIDSKYKNNLYKYYCDNIINLTELDIKLLDWCFNSIKDKITDLNLNIDLLFIFDNIKIAKLQHYVDNGYPHTNSNVIFLTSTFINQLLPYFNSNNIDYMIINIGSIIIHECVHIWQRKKRNDFEILYKKYWNFTKPNKINNKSIFRFKLQDSIQMGKILIGYLI